MVSAAPATPARLYAQSLAAARAQGSVHYDSTVALADRTVRIHADIARDRGRKTVELRVGPAVGRMVVVVVRRTAYVRADAFTLRSYLGLTAQQARRYDGRWFSVRAVDPPFATVGVAVTVGSAFDDLQFPGPFRFATAPPGERAVASRYVTAGQPIDTTISLRAGGKHLPVRQVSRNPAVGTITTSFRRWNEPVTVAAPRGALPLRP